jgi:hypothetical protein
MIMNPDLMEYRNEIARLERMAKKLKKLGMSERANGYSAEIYRLNLRLDKLELQFHRKALDK